MKVQLRPFHTGWCYTNSTEHEKCPTTVTVERKDKQGVYTKSWTCNCQCHKEAASE